MGSSKPRSLSKTISEVVGFLLLSAFYIVQAIVKFFLPKKYHNYKDVKGEIALVTGGGGGLGRLLALRLAKLGATVVLWDINVAGLEETVNLVNSIGGKAFAFKCDISDKDDVYKAAEITRQEVGDVQILINNAGIATGDTLLATPDHLIKKTFEVNVIAHFWTVKSFLPKMIEKNHGHIVTVASMAGFVGSNKLVTYCATKYAAVGFDDALRVELESQGIFGVKTTAICPFFIQSTGMFNDVNARYIPTLKPNDVADRIIEALQKDETVVLMPNWFSIALVLRMIVPWSVVSLCMRGLVIDPTPKQTAAKTNGSAKIEDFPQKSNGSVKESVSTLNHRIVTNGKNVH
ncbi:unnamed protein product [Brassicogethes aeneus]|uniref:Uncharacterized protein n=1 Tax=Brassicogethes aeneus TaxID=1431903 RepID=A0A9P0BIP0_BRAAE|nr:unnamed protein product [Brassicogethes aeneus]